MNRKSSRMGESAPARLVLARAWGLSLGLSVMLLAFPIAQAAPDVGGSIGVGNTETNAEASTVAGPAPELLRAAVAGVQSRLALSESWQRKLFNDEVIPQYARFIRDVRREGDRFVIDADLEAIKRYLVFYAPKSLHREDLRLMVFARADRDCIPCNDSLSEVRRLIFSRVESRGFKVHWVTGEELSGTEATLTGTALDSRVEEIAREGNAAAALVVELRKVGSTGSLARLHLLTRADTETQYSGHREVAQASTTASSVSLLLADAFIDLGGRAVLAASQDGTVAEAPEVAIHVTGMTDFASFQKARDSLTEALTQIGTVEKRSIKQGEVYFGVKTAKTPREVSRTLASAPNLKGKLKLLGADDQAIETEIVP